MGRRTFNRPQRIAYDECKVLEPVTVLHEGSVGTGKTVILINQWLDFVWKHKGEGKNFIMMGYTLGSLKSNVLDEMEEMYGLEIKLDKDNRFSLFGNTMRCYGSNNADSYKAMRGFNSQGALCNEVTLSHKMSYAEVFNRCRLDGFRIFMDCNPDHPKHHIKSNVIDEDGKVDENGTLLIKSYHYDIEDNVKDNGGFLSRTYVNNLKANTPSGILYDRNILGLWSSARGTIYGDWNVNTMVVDECPVMVRYFMGIDWGYEHYGSLCVVGEGVDGKFYLVEAYREQHKQIEYWESLKVELCSKYNIPNSMVYCDSARPEYVSRVSGVNASKKVIEGIYYVGGLMVKDMFRVCKGSLGVFETEIYEYVWKKTDGKEEPEKHHDDLLDGMRYALYSYWREGRCGGKVKKGVTASMGKRRKRL